jgi:hypothetical protein
LDVRYTLEIGIGHCTMKLLNFVIALVFVVRREVSLNWNWTMYVKTLNFVVALVYVAHREFCRSLGS